ncbi:MAG: hypothetical protein GYA87_07655 [Christensenellaceae bacterium]|nr:hypothetical protein [Christensenellaceae bacterium]
MKKLLAFLIAFLFMPNIAFAEGDLQVVDSNLIFVNNKNGYFFASVQNKGDKPVCYDNGVLNIVDKEGKTVFSNDFIRLSPYTSTINPGEYMYVMDRYISIENIKDTEGLEPQFTVTAIEPEDEYAIFENEATFEINDALEGSYMYVTFTNTSDEVKYDIAYSIALLDADGKIIFCDDKYTGLGLHPNATVTASIYINDDIIEHFAENNIVPVKADAVVKYGK